MRMILTVLGLLSAAEPQLTSRGRPQSRLGFGWALESDVTLPDEVPALRHRFDQGLEWPGLRGRGRGPEAVA